MFNIKKAGFTLIELLVVISIIGILSAIVYASFDEARKQARDKSRSASLKELQLAIELYKAQYGFYPAKGCGAATDFAGPGPASSSGLSSCAAYITGVVPDFIPALPTDPRFETDANRGFYYRTDASGASYKLMVLDVVETLEVASINDEYSRCPTAAGACASGVASTTYAVYSAGAEGW